MALMLMGVTTSCFKMEEPNIFDESAAERLEHAITEYSDILTDKGGVWALEYFANTEEQGYVYTMKFSKNGSVEMSAKNEWVGYVKTGENTNVFGSETSMWEVIADNGPVLTFNTYNTIFHIFANPEDIPTTEGDEQGYGHEGDYEFDLMRYSNDTLYLEGKKYGVPMKMYRLSAETTGEEYFAKIDNVIAAMNVTKFPDLVLTGADGNRYIVNDIATLVPSIYPEGGDWVTQTVSTSTIVTADGFRFATPLQLVNKDGGSTLTVQSFKLQEDGSLLCTDDNKSVITCDNLNTVFSDELLKWRTSSTSFGGKFKPIYDAVVAGCKAAPLKRTFRYFQFEYSGALKTYVLNFLDQTTNGNFYTNVEKVGTDQVKISYKGELDNNAQVHVNNVSAFTDMLNAIGATTFKVVSMKGALNPTTIRLQSADNAEDYIELNVY